LEILHRRIKKQPPRCRRCFHPAPVPGMMFLFMPSFKTFYYIFNYTPYEKIDFNKALHLLEKKFIGYFTIYDLQGVLYILFLSACHLDSDGISVP